jgi:Cu-processing system ATP-binding protein
LKEPVIEVRAVSRRFGDIHAVDNVEFSVAKGEIFGLIGHNGAGKSTLLKMMLGLLPPTKGEIRINGESVRGAGFRKVRRRIAYLPENIVLYENLSGLETLLFFAALKGADKRTCLPLLEKVGLGHAARRAVRGYSKGMRQRLGFAQALLGGPDILFLDEPTTGLDPEATRDFYRILEELKEQGVTAILSSHHLAEIQERLDRLALMKTGRIQASGTVQSLRVALKLPLHIQVILHAGAEHALRTALQGIAGCELSVHAERANIVCDRQEKMRVLARLTDLRDAITDIHLREPSLEDVFLGYAEA